MQYDAYWREAMRAGKEWRVEGRKGKKNETKQPRQAGWMHHWWREAEGGGRKEKATSGHHASEGMDAGAER